MFSERVVVHNILLAEQEAPNYCGIAGLQILLNFEGIDVEQSDLAKLVNVTSLGINRDDFFTISRHFGFPGKGIKYDSLDGILSKLYYCPLLIQEFKPIITNHIVVGYGFDRKNIFIHDPELIDSGIVPYKEFVKKIYRKNKGKIEGGVTFSLY